MWFMKMSSVMKLAFKRWRRGLVVLLGLAEWIAPYEL